MRRWRRRLSGWFFQLENEILLPFLAVGIIVICGFGAISFYNGYTIQKRSLKAMAKQLFEEANQDIDFLAERIPEEEIREKYKKRRSEHLRITDPEGEIIAGPGRELEEALVIPSEQDNVLGWRIEFLVDRQAFMEEILESQTYVVIGAIAALLIIIQASIFISYNIAFPIRNMSRTCHEINENRRSYRSYHFDAVKRRDEIGRLATTFELLLKNMDNYTKMEYTSRMSATLAHEIKNPIAGIRSGIQVLKGRAAKDGDRLLCASMIKEIDRVTALITNLFTLSVKKDSVREPVAVEPLLRELELFYGKGLRQQGIAFSAGVKGEGEKPGGPIALINGNELRQILHNLISNSVKAMRQERSGEISLEALEERGQVKLILTDNGCGMTEEELERAMEPFYTKSINGIGLGLAIVKKLVEGNGGTMEMDSFPGTGTQVRLSFPKAFGQDAGETGESGETGGRA